MARFSVSLKRSAVKELEAVARKKDRRLLVRRIGDLADNPRPPGCEKLSGHEKYRVRQGPYRIVYSVDDESDEVVIVKIAHRKDVYR